jgi:hypothetical protein
LFSPPSDDARLRRAVEDCVRRADADALRTAQEAMVKCVGRWFKKMAHSISTNF